MFNALDAAKKIPVWAYWSLVAVVAIYVIKKGSVQNAAQGVTAAAVSAAGGIVKGAAGGVVLGVGDVLGVPRTNLASCKQAIINADNGKALNYCSAGVFARWQYLSGRKKLTGQTFTMNDIFN